MKQQWERGVGMYLCVCGGGEGRVTMVIDYDYFQCSP